MKDSATPDKRYTYTQIVAKIKEMIDGGELSPGDRLPPERKLAERFMVSRTSLRQALQALSERKIIESRQGDGTYLLTTFNALSSDDAILDAILQQRNYLHDIIEFRQIIEPKIAALACQSLSQEQLDDLKVVVCDQQRALMNNQEDSDLDAKFHMLLAEATGNRVLCQVMKTVQNILNDSRTIWLQSQARKNASVEGHFRILDALESKDPAKAYAAMFAHINEIEHIILDGYQSDKRK